MDVERIAKAAGECAIISGVLETLDQEALREIVAMGDSLVNYGITQDPLRQYIHNATKMILCFSIEFRKIKPPKEMGEEEKNESDDKV